jgi:hypothetical protein
MSANFAAQDFYRLAKDNMESNASRCARARLYCPTAADLLQPYRKYPAAIQSAVLAVDTRPEFINLSRAQKAVLRTLLTRAEAADGRKPIQVHFDRAGAECGVSVKTVARTVELLIAARWLERAGEARDEYGAFTYRQFRFTCALCDLVALPRRHRTSSSRPVNKDQSFKDQPGIGAIAPETPTPPAIDLPPELQALPAELDIKPTGIAKLRGIASRAGHRLADIVACARRQLEQLRLRGNRAFRYLEAMCGKTSDYAARAADLAHQATEQAQVRRSRDRAATYAGKQYRARSGELIRIFGHAAEVIRDGISIGTMAGRQMQQVYDDIEAGRLIPA